MAKTILKKKVKRKTSSAKRVAPRPAAPGFDASSLPGPDAILRVELPNGMVVLARENFTSPAVVINGSLRAGSLDESRARAGLARFTAAALMRGTESRTFAEIYEQIESLGARLGMGGGTHTSSFGGKALAEDLDTLLGLAADALRRPAFPAEHVEKLRGQLLTGLAIRAHDTGAMASLAFDEMLYPDHPYGLTEDGYPETVSAITRDDLVNFHRAYYSPQQMILVIVGAVKAADAVALAQKHFGDWQAARPARPALPPVPPLGEIKKRRVAIPGKTQADLVLGCVGPQRSDPDYIAAQIANNIFGVFGMYGRLGDVVREKHGLAYYVYGQITGGLGPGPWQIGAGVAPRNVDLAVELIVREMERLTQKKVTAAELAENQSNFVGRLPLTLETNEGVAAMIERMELYQLGLDYLRRYPALVNSITRADVQAVAAKYLHPARYVLAVAGPGESNDLHRTGAVAVRANAE
ncbi:MAG: insulinase family protein [Chloroflexi bacterium]|nr:insulinase family protein [Chloroflexota bacterium]